jgi:FMN phosphatase YigB (HAD superfamily)
LARAGRQGLGGRTVSRPRRPAVLSLDVWYTLLYLTAEGRRSYEAARRRAWSAALEAAGVDGPTTDRWLAALFRETKAREARGRAFSVSHQHRWVEKRVGVPFDGARVSRSLDRAVDGVDYRIAPGALAMVDRMRESGYDFAMVSNIIYENPEPVRRLLARTGLLRRIPTLILSNEVGSAKPSPRPIQLALRELGSSASQALHLGDQPADIRSAWRAGVAAAHFTGLRRFWPPTHLRSLPGALAKAPSLSGWARLTPQSVESLWSRAVAARP